jgi:hypothetical protein
VSTAKLAQSKTAAINSERLQKETQRLRGKQIDATAQNNAERQRLARKTQKDADANTKARLNLSEKELKQRGRIADKHPALVQSWEYGRDLLANAKTPAQKRYAKRFMSALDGSLKRDASSLSKSDAAFTKAHQKAVADNGGALDAAGWKALKDSFASNPNAIMFEVFKARTMQNTGGGGSSRGGLKNLNITNK